MKSKPTYNELIKEVALLKEQLAENDINNYYKLFFEDNEAIILFVDTDNQDIIFSNKSAQSFYGYSKSEFRNMKISDIHTLSPEEIAAKMKIIKKTKNNFFIFKHRTSSGEIKDVEVYQTKLKLKDKVVFSIIVLDISEKMKVEAKLKASELVYRDYFEKDISGFYRSTPEGKLMFCNTVFADMLGYTVDELLKINTVKLYPNEEDRISFIAEINQTRNIHNKEIDLVKKNGDIIHCIENVAGIFDNNGKLINFQGFIFNITERKKTEIALLESEARFKRLFEDLGDAVFVARIEDNHRGDIIEANAAAVTQTGYSKEELMEMNIIRDIYVEGSGDLTFEDWDEKFHNEDIVTTVEQKRRKNGTIYWTEVIVTPIDYNGIPASLSINHDITSRINSNLALEKSERKFRELFEKSGDAFLIINNRKFVDCNSAAIKMLNYENKDEVTKLHPSELSPKHQPDGQLSAVKADNMMSKCMELGTHRFEWDHKKRNGEVFPVEVLLTAISNDPDNEIIHTVWTDITKRIQNQKDLIIAKEKAEESDRLKSAFLANMSHEIRTPMNGILGFASLLKLPTLNREQLSKYVNIIEKSGIRMLNIINDLMDISKIEAGQMEVNMTSFNLNEQIEYLHSFFLPEAEKEELKLSYKYSLVGDESIIYSDNEKLNAILVNLLKNSIKYSEDGSINFGYEKKGEDLLFHVCDTGMGIPEERQSAIFERFVQADIEDSKAMEGAGLGLAISKAYVEMLNGSIWLESIEGSGTTFYFTIPYISKSSKRKKSESNSSNLVKVDLSEKKRNILIADDEIFANTFLQIAVKEITNKIFTASNGREVLDILRANTDIDLILMDIKMPLLNGYEATEEIRKFNKDVIIIAQTAYALPGDNIRAIDAGCNDYISKPIDKKLLLEKIEHWFDEIQKFKNRNENPKR